MSEQSGPITREQVERAIAGCQRESLQAVADALGGSWWVKHAPQDVRDAWHGDGSGWGTAQAERLEAALTRWRDELAAAETPRKVARWDGMAYALDPHHVIGEAHIVRETREEAIAWGYEIEGGPEPVRDWKSDRAIAAIWPTPKPAEDSPERLRERREALGWTTAYAGHWVAWFDHTDVERAECGRGVPAFVARYAAALSAEEARLAAEGADRVIAAIGRPAPRFKVGDRVTSGLGGPWKIGRVEWGRLVPEADCDEWVYHHASGNVSACESVLALAWTPTPASPPAPEVVDVPQPIVKRCGGVEAQWDLGEDHVTLVEPARGVGLPAPLALLRAMLAAIDAQQGGAS